MTTRVIFGTNFDDFCNLINSIIELNSVDANINIPLDAITMIQSCRDLVKVGVSNVKSELEKGEYVSVDRVNELKERLINLNYYEECLQKALTSEREQINEILREIENL